MDHVKTSGQEHDFQQAGDTAQHVDADLQTLAVTDQPGDLPDQCADRRWRVVQAQTQHAHRLASLRIQPCRHGPVALLRHIDANRYVHLAPFTPQQDAASSRRPRPTQRWVAEPDQQSERSSEAGGNAA